MSRASSIVAGIVFLLSSTSIVAKGFEQLLKGDYAFSGEATCIVSIGGFNDDLTPVGAPAPFPRIQSFSIHGVRTFNGDGTGTVVARAVTIAHPFALPTPTPFFNRGGAGSVDLTSPFTYEVTPDLKVEVTTPLVTGNVLTGTRAGQTLRITGLPTFHGQISQNLHSLTLAHEDPAVELHSFSNGDSDERICHRSRVVLELKTPHRRGED